MLVEVLQHLARRAEGGTLTFETANVDLDAERCQAIPAEIRPGHYILVMVSDTGSGMDEETIKRIFEPFFTTKEIGKGTDMVEEAKM